MMRRATAEPMKPAPPVTNICLQATPETLRWTPLTDFGVRAENYASAAGDGANSIRGAK